MRHSVGFGGAGSLLQATSFPFCSNHLFLVLLETWLPLLIQASPSLIDLCPRSLHKSHQESFDHGSSFLPSRFDEVRFQNGRLDSFLLLLLMVLDKAMLFQGHFCFRLRDVLSLHGEGRGPRAGTPTVWHQDSRSSDW